MTNFNITIVSDTVCPWCYVGKKRLEKGISQYRTANPDTKDTFSITWAPFYLNPDASREGIDKLGFYKAKLGSRFESALQNLTALGKEEGINFSFRGLTGHTRDSHRLIQLGKTKSPALQTRVVEELFAAYFENEQNITSHAVLKAAGLKAGLEAAEIDEWLSSDKGGEAVDREVEQAQSEYISGVPNFTIQNKFRISGAQDPSVFVQVFERIKKSEPVEGSLSEGPSC